MNLPFLSVCSGVCRHVNKRCTPHLIVEVLQPEERERKNSKVQFKESTEVIVELRVRMGGCERLGGVKGV